MDGDDVVGSDPRLGFLPVDEREVAGPLASVVNDALVRVRVGVGFEPRQSRVAPFCERKETGKNIKIKHRALFRGSEGQTPPKDQKMRLRLTLGGRDGKAEDDAEEDDLIHLVDCIFPGKMGLCSSRPRCFIFIPFAFVEDGGGVAVQPSQSKYCCLSYFWGRFAKRCGLHCGLPFAQREKLTLAWTKAGRAGQLRAWRVQSTKFAI